VNRSLQNLPGFLEQASADIKEISGWKARVKSNKSDLPLSAYTGVYKNTLYGKIRISQSNNQLIIHYETKPDLSATLDYMDKGEWLLTYNNILYGIFQVKFDISGNNVTSLTTLQNPFVEYDPYVFTKSQQ
jgi:hypothetical protein